MSTLKTVTSALTAVVLVSGIGLAVAQTEDQKQPTDPVAASTAAPLSEQTPADPNAAPADVNAMPTDSTAAVQQPAPADDPAKVTPPVDSTAATPTTTTTDTTTTTTTTPSPSYDQPATPAPRADRH
ncbi:hypothetical protein ACS5PN_12060 [Roseateles sp. NT4]|uniref:hypothetical protein n=1 Tax=Roseateles sp. NT4 TaxID=3453715 RepID=UPI003EEAA49D